jgi:putative hydrolase of the HAD superfamily
MVDATFRGLIEALPSETFFPHLFERFSEPNAWRVFEDVLPTLSALQTHGLKLGIVSNWDDRLRSLLRRLDLDTYFETVVVSCEVGAHKPARQLFDLACLALESDPAETLHVGDSLEMDVRGAAAAGLRALWLRRSARGTAPHTIHSLRELDKI